MALRSILFPLLFGVAGTAVLLGLGFWQVGRLAEKEAYLAEIDERISKAPVTLPDNPDPAQDRFLSVEANGRFAGPEIDVLASRKTYGAGFRVISVFETTDGRRILVDRGFLPTDQRGEDRGQGNARIVGNLHWPDEVDGYTPEPDERTKMWFARDVPAMADALGTEPVLIVLRETSETDPVVTPFPVDSSGIPNDHLEYAITWFSLAAVWIGMTLYLLWRINRRTA